MKRIINRCIPSSLVWRWVLLAVVFATATAVLSCTFFDCRGNVGKITVRSFEECVSSGFPVVSGDPQRCVVDSETIFLDVGANIQITRPAAGETVDSPFVVAGEARARENIVKIRLLDSSGAILAEATVTTDSTEHARFGAFEVGVNFNLPSETDATLELFDGDAPDDPDGTTVRIPLNLVVDKSAADEPKNFDPLASAPTEIPDSVTLDVPFTSQAPILDWSPPYNETCEEAALLMAEYFLRGEKLSVEVANRELLDLVAWENQNSYSVDADTDEVADFARSYFEREATVYSGVDATIDNIRRLLAAGFPVIIPAAGQLLGNPNFTGAGPPYHMLTITGFRGDTFITNDPGTRIGKDYEYSAATIDNVLHDWNGDKNTILSGRRAFLVIGK
ncbi:MAG: Gmad2 immunoglobulin-like domain-containing protein [Candidatus Peribacteraceae bacterium]|nr:Gmad2 immunoglobulin-like domain-containing protein [Candidatus Peribacteraceae bacterium]